MQSQYLDQDTQLFARQLVSCPLFSRVGQESAVCRTWREAIALDNEAWESFRLEVSNDTRTGLLTISQELLNTWNEAVCEAKRSIEPYLNELAQVNADAPWLCVISSVKWDWIAAICEHHYRQWLPITFYRRLADVYCHGHFPCGWEGALDSGHPLFY